jgi:predicted small secreted protein
MQLFIATAFIASSLVSLSACNTFQGIGEDFKSAGQVIKETAEDTKRKIGR